MSLVRAVANRGDPDEFFVYDQPASAAFLSESD